MRICHIFENFSPFTMGGVERQIQLISNFLSNTDPNLKFSLITDRNCLVPSLHPNLSKFQNYGNLRVFRLGPNPAKFAKAFLDRSQKIFVKKEIRKINIIQKNLEFQLFLEASKIDDVRNADIFHLHGMWDTVYDSLALELSKYFGKPLIVHLRGTYILGAEAMPCPAKEGRAILEHASAIITHNSNVFRKLENWKLEKKAHIIPNGIDIQEFQFKARDTEKKM